MKARRRKQKLEPDQVFGMALREFRTQKGISQEHLAELADVHRTFVSDIERGERNPTVKTIWKLAEALNTSPSKLLAIAEKLYYA